MLRKTISSAIISLVVTTPCFSGLYIGAAIGPEGGYFTQRSHVTRVGTFDVIDTEHFAGVGGFGSIFAGYGRAFNQFYLAGEVNANLSSLKYELKNEEFIHQTLSKTTFTIKQSEGISILPGYLVSASTLVYARLGYANGYLKIAESDPTIQSINKHRSGFRYGVGITHALTPRLAMRMDYSQTNYQGVHSSVFEPFGMVSKNTKISPLTAQVAFGLIYNFDQPIIDPMMK